MVTITKHAKVKVFTQGFGHDEWDSFLYIPIELGPVIGGEGRHVDVGVGQVKDEARIMFLLEASHHMGDSFQVAFPGVPKM
jgi:hypothetical protein